MSDLPECCTKYKDHIFVYGSNLAARNGKGAALHAKLFHGALSVPHGMAGSRAYAIPTKDAVLRPLPLETVKGFVFKFLQFASSNVGMQFYVTAVGTGLAGYTKEQIAPMFRGAPENCFLPEGWR